MRIITIALTIPCAVLMACSPKAPVNAPTTEPMVSQAADVAAPAPRVSTAAVTLAAKSGSAVKGDLKFAARYGSVTIDGEIWGLTPGDHGMHVHETGDCSALDAKSAGDHLNPEHTEHGGGPTSPSRHLGDIPNIQADASGHAVVSASIAGATLQGSGPTSLIGKALVVHAQRDDYLTQPAGDSGDRIACGVIK